MAYSSPLAPPDFDLQLAAHAGLHSLNNFISLFSPAAAAAAASPLSSLRQLQHQQSMAATETISNFKFLGSLLSPRQGHARVRCAPRVVYPDSLHSCTPNIPFPVNPTSPIRNPSLPSSASDQGFPLGHPSISNYGSASTSFEECDSVGIDDEEQSIRGSSHIDLNNQIGNYDYIYEGSINNKSARRAFNYTTEDTKSKDNHSNFKANYDNNPKLGINYGFPSLINDTNPSCFDLNQQAPPSLDSTSQTSNYYLLPASSREAPLFCPQPINTFPPPSEESFSFAVHTQSVAADASPSLPVRPLAPANTRSASSADGEFPKFASNPSQKSMPVYEGAGGHNHHQASLSTRLARIFSTNPQFEAHLEKAACNMISTTPTHSSPLSCLSVEGNLLTNGKMPPGAHQLQPANNMASMEEHMIKASSANQVKRKCPSISADDSNLTKCGNTPSKCQCAKRRKLKKKSIVRVPAISEKIAEIPQDDYSWRKYGQKPIKGSPFPRGYYKCSGVKGCPAKKHVERAPDDPSMLIITYEGEHIHSRPMVAEPLQN